MDRFLFSCLCCSIDHFATFFSIAMVEIYQSTCKVRIFLYVILLLLPDILCSYLILSIIIFVLVTFIIETMIVVRLF